MRIRADEVKVGMTLNPGVFGLPKRAKVTDLEDNGDIIRVWFGTTYAAVSPGREFEVETLTQKETVV